MTIRTYLIPALVAAGFVLPASAETLRIQTHYAPETVSGKTGGAIRR